jgi:peroxiredoxin
MMNRLLRTSIALAAVAGVAWAWRGGWQHAAPDLSFHSIRGEAIRLADFRGHPVMVTFWATDCRTCLVEIPEFDRLQKEYARRGFRLIAIAMSYDVPSRVLSLVRETGLGYTVALDPQGRLAAGFGGVEFVPVTFFIAPDGKITGKIVGPLDFELARNQISNMMGDS